MTYPEMNLLNSNNARTATSDYWLAGPSHIHSGNYYIYHYKNAAGGALNTYTTDTAYRVRPAISLKSTAIKYNKGLGTYDRPYVVDLSS